MMKTKHKRMLIPALVAVLLLALLVPFTGCEDLGYPAPAATPEATPEAAKMPTVTVSSRNEAQLAVYQSLLEMATSPEAKNYLADFYTAADNWTAISEVFRDGSGIWQVQVDMTAVAEWPYHPYWRQAAWYVYKGGQVMPASLYQANALRIEADIQALGAIEAEMTEAAK